MDREALCRRKKELERLLVVERRVVVCSGQGGQGVNSSSRRSVEGAIDCFC